MARRPEPREGHDSLDGAANESLLERVLAGRLLVLAPHMDDETLGCGGAMLLHRHKPDIHCLFATDSAGSPAPLLPWQGRPDAGLADRRRNEAVAATGKLGIPCGNLHFLDLPDGGLVVQRARLVAKLQEVISRLRPEFVFAPFRYDVHPDHVALNQAIRTVLRRLPSPPVLLEYFVYHRLRFIPGGDVRLALEPGRLLELDAGPVAAVKRAALDCYVSQTSLDYPWQDRPILTKESLRQRCAEPECFLPTDPWAPLAEGIAGNPRRLWLATFAMRLGKRPKDRAFALVRWMLGR